MHPAYSVIVFTTASGAGYGLLILAIILALLGNIEPTRWLGLTVFGLGLALVTTGLLSSTFHLGRPERAWRAFSQWKTSWLSREGVLAVFTFIPILAFAYGWIMQGTVALPWMIAGAIAIMGALATVWCTGMIYASLKTVRRWHDPMVAPLYVLLSAITGGVLLNTLLIAFGQPVLIAKITTAILLVLGLLAKMVYWKRTDNAAQTHTSEAATGLGFIGEVRPLEPPHTQPNYVMREMGYEIGRKHAKRLRTVSMAFGFILPLIATAMTIADGSAAFTFSLLALAGSVIGILVERWLFFAEAQHVVTLYYGAQTA